VTDFGAFVDIGVGRDGLVHVSEMGTGRVAKATDVVNQGDSIRVWIKELDREKNRISLSMIAPGTLTMRDLEEGMIVPGKVTRLERYGAFIDIGVGRDGMLHVKEMGHGYVQNPEDVVQVGQDLRVQVVGLDRRRGRIDLSIKELLPKPEPQPVVAVAAPFAAPVPAQEAFPVSEDSFVSPFELALQEANDGKRTQRRDRRKKARAWEVFEDEDDIVERTLAHHRKSQ
jgi:transcriptional accessory protein Tex/SPT6